MPTTKPVNAPEEQLLGEIQTRIAGMQYYDATIHPGEQVNLEREPENRHDSHSIRVENGRFELVGHLPRKIVAWLAPLVDSGYVRLDGCVPRDAEPIPKYTSSLPLKLTIFLSSRAQHLTAPRDVRSKMDALHEVVRRTYEAAQGYADEDLILGLVEGFRPFGGQELLPETRLLMAMLPGIAAEKRSAKAIRGMARLHELLGTLHIGDPLHVSSLTIFPLIWPNSHEPSYSLLEPAIEAGMAMVEEVNEDGSVPTLGVTNNGDLPILIPEGEILVGAKQNRVVNITVLVAARSRFVLPVSCVEQGRWQYRRRDFRGEYAAPPSLRSKKFRSVQRSRRERGDARSDQGEVWNDVTQCLSAIGVESETASLTDGYVALEEALQELRDQLELPTDAAGFLASRGARIVGMDLFGSPQIFAPIKQRLLDAYLLDSLRNKRRCQPTKPPKARQFIKRAGGSASPRMPSLGEGIELEIKTESIVGGALLYSNQLCHLAAFHTIS